MAVPKRRMSRANTRARRSQWKANNAALQNVTIDGHTYRIPRRLVRAARMGRVEVEQFSYTTRLPHISGVTVFLLPSPQIFEETVFAGHGEIKGKHWNF